MNTSEQKINQRFFGKLRFENLGECWLWNAYCNEGGYGILPVKEFRENKAHRVAWRLFHGSIPLGRKVLHRCDTPACVNPDHLFLGSQADNVADMCAKRRNRSPGLAGEANPQAKLTADNVRRMKIRRSQGAFYWAIAEEFGVTTMTAHRAINGKCWRMA